MTATTARAEFLKTQDRFAVASNATIETRWGEDALDTRQSSALADEADAQAEASRQLAQMADVRAIDVATVEGIHSDLEGQTVVLAYAGRLGMSATAEMLVTAVAINRQDGTTQMTGQVILP